MSRNTLIGRLLTPGGLLAALGLFLLPLFTISCTAPRSDPSVAPDPAPGAVHYTGLDIITDDYPTYETQFNGLTSTVDISVHDEELAAGPLGEIGLVKLPLPAVLRGTVLGAAAAIALGLLVPWLIAAPLARRFLVAALALVAGGALVFAVYVAAPNFLRQSQNSGLVRDSGAYQMGLTDATTSPAVGFWVIASVLAAVIVLQLVPTRPPTPSAVPPPDPAPPPDLTATPGPHPGPGEVIEVLPP